MTGRRTLAQRRDDAAREMALITEIVADTPGHRGPDWWVEVAARVCARHRVRSLHERARGTPNTGEPKPAPISARQLQIIGLIADGLSYSQAATRLHLSADTIRNHLRRAYRSLGAEGAPHAIAVCLRNGWIT